MINVHSNLYCEITEYYCEYYNVKKYFIADIYAYINEEYKVCRLNNKSVYLNATDCLQSALINVEFKSIQHAIMHVFSKMNLLYYYVGYNAYTINNSYIESLYPGIRIDIKSGLCEYSLAKTIAKLNEIFGDKSSVAHSCSNYSIICINVVCKKLRLKYCNDDFTLKDFVIMLLTIYRLNELKRLL